MTDINVHDLEVEANNTLQHLANIIKRRLKRSFPSRDLGFALLAFDFNADGELGFMNYVSNSQRSDMIKALRETADALESGARLTDRRPGTKPTPNTPTA